MVTSISYGYLRPYSVDPVICRFEIRRGTKFTVPDEFIIFILVLFCVILKQILETAITVFYIKFTHYVHFVWVHELHCGILRW